MEAFPPDGRYDPDRAQDGPARAGGPDGGRRTRVVIADDHPLFRSGLSGLLATLPAVEVVGEAESGRAVVPVVRETRPDIVLMDIQMDDGDGIEATRRIVAENPDTVVLGMTMVDDQGAVLAMMRAGARGYLLKGAGADELSRAVEAVRSGHMIFSSDVGCALFEQINENNGVAPQAFPELTERERAVLEMVADGRDNSVIARELHLSVKTVRNYLSRIFTKLQVAHRAEAAVVARREGLGH